MKMTYPLLACLATEVFAPPTMSDDISLGWIIQPKIDGHRVIIDYRTSLPRTLNRNGRTYSAGPFRIPIPDVMKGYVIDGEYEPKSRRYFIFDVLKHPEDADLNYDRPLLKRQDMVAALHFDLLTANAGEQWHMVTQHRARTAKTMDLWTSYYRDKTLSGELTYPCDGVIYKRPSKGYSPGRGTDHWLKFKFTATLDAYVSRMNIDSKSNCALSLHDPLSGTEFEVGKVSTHGKTGIKVGTVVEVRFLKFTGSRLREPRIVHVRDDKRPEDCQIDQLIPFVPSLAEDA